MPVESFKELNERQAAAGAPAPDAAGPAAVEIGAVLEELFVLLEERKRELPEGSYTTRLLSGPQDKLLKKIGEEASEVIIAARDHDAGQTRYEIADLVYHLLVVMVREGIPLGALAGELAGRRK